VSFLGLSVGLSHLRLQLAARDQLALKSERPKRVRRPRLVSHLGRWGRARRWLPPDARYGVDVGCAFGYGTAAMTGHGYRTKCIIGVERDPEHLEQATRLYPWVPVVRADAAALPFATAAVDAVIMLDVVEHVADAHAVLAEARRVLRDGGSLVMSVPNSGLLASLDPYNAYTALRRRWRSWPPLVSYDESATGTHRHFSLEEARDLLGPGFSIDRVARTGTGVSELLDLLLTIVFFALLGCQRAYPRLRFLHFLAYVVDDLVPVGPSGYHLTLRARAV